MATATPGPWRQAKPNRLHVIGETQEDGVRKIVASAAGETSLFEPGEADANARLIAAAPELLEIAKLLIGTPASLGLHIEEIQRRADAVVAKAEGRL